jgi:hypothetical protein
MNVYSRSNTPVHYYGESTVVRRGGRHLIPRPSSIGFDVRGPDRERTRVIRCTVLQ